MPGPDTGWKPDATHWQDASVTSTSRRAPSTVSLAEWLRNTRTRLFAVAISLAALTPVFGQTPPGITTQPADQVVDAGSTATFRVTASGTAPLSYQWRFNDANLAGRTTNSLVLSNVQSPNVGNYTVVVTNASGPPITSRTALLSLPTVHRLDGIIANPDHTISLSLAGVVPNVFAPYYDIYPIEASTNMVDWSPLATLLRTNASPDALSYRDSGATNLDQRFYRTPANLLITPFPKPTGPYPVGTVSRMLTDPSRTNRYFPGNSSFMVTIWYPAEARAGVLPAAYGEREVIPISPEMVGQFVSHAFPGLPLAPVQTRYPVVIYSHSLTTGLFRRQNSDKSEELASHGYVVVAVDHINAATSVFPNGQVVHGAYPADRCDRAAFQTLLDHAIKDIRFVLDELNTNDTLLAGRMDFERLGALGYSWGCTPVAEFGRIDPRCKAVVLLDAGRLLQVPVALNQLGLQKPFLSMNRTMGSTDPDPCPNWGPPLYASLLLFTNALNHALWFQIQDSWHDSFDERGGLIYGPTLTFEGGPTPASRAISQTTRACTLSFFNKYLKNQDDHLLDNPAAVYPNVINFQSK